MLGLWHGKALTDKDILTLTQFISVLNYFAGVNLLVWLRNMYGCGVQRHPVYETIVHVYLYLVYLLEVFNIIAKYNVVHIVYAVFVVIMFACHVNLCHKFRRLIRQTCEPSSMSTLFGSKKTASEPAFWISVAIVCAVWLVSASIAVVFIAAESCWQHQAAMTDFLEMTSSASSFNLVLKVSFMTVSVDAYFSVGLRLVRGFRSKTPDLQLILPPVNSDTKDKCVLVTDKEEASPKISLPRGIVSAFVFFVMLTFTVFPQTLNLVLKTYLSRDSLHMTGAIIMQMLFIIDASCHVVSHHGRRLLRPR